MEGEANDINMVKNLMEQASQESQIWHDILDAANQALELTKCKYHVIHYQFKPSGQPEMAIDETTPEELKVKNKQGNPVTITHVPNHKAVKYLGCWKAPIGQKDQKKALQQKCANYAKVINCSHLTQNETKYFYEGIYKTSVGYPLPITYLTFQELDKIQSKAHQAMITHCGYNRYTANAVIYGVRKWGGCNIHPSIRYTRIGTDIILREIVANTTISSRKTGPNRTQMGTV